MVIMRDALSAAEHNDLGVVYEKKGLFSLAEKEYGKALEKDRSWPLPLFNWATSTMPGATWRRRSSITAGPWHWIRTTRT
jgi:hypothetical protein